MITTIVVGTDGSTTAGEAVRVAAGMARSFGARLHLVRAYRLATVAASTALVPEASVGLAEADEQIRGEAERHLAALAAELRATGVDVEVHLTPLGAAEAIISCAESLAADLVVVGNRGMQGKRRLLGSVPNTVTHHAPCSVLVVKTTD